MKSQLRGGECMYKAELLSLLLKRAGTLRDAKMVLTLQLFCPFLSKSTLFYHIQNFQLKVPTSCSRNRLTSLTTSKFLLFLLFQQNSNQCNSESSFHDGDSALYISAIYLQQNHYPRASSKSRLWYHLICIWAKLKTFKNPNEFRKWYWL